MQKKMLNERAEDLKVNILYENATDFDNILVKTHLSTFRFCL